MYCCFKSSTAKMWSSLSLICAAVVSVSVARILPSTTEEEVLQYLDGLEVPDFSSALYHPPMKMDYKFSNVVLGHNAELTGKYSGKYDFTDTTVKIEFFADEGWINGYMSAVASYSNSPNFKFPMEGNFQLHAFNSTINLELLIPSFTSDKNNLINLISCDASYDALTMDFNSTAFTKREDKTAMDSWLSKSLHGTFREAYCLAIEHDFAKGTKSAAVSGILTELLRLAFGSFALQG